MLINTNDFHILLGLHPTLEDMQITVCRNKARVMFPADWKYTRAAKCIRETIEDCTDQDGEARLTALCVQERLTHVCRGTVYVCSIVIISIKISNY